MEKYDPYNPNDLDEIFKEMNKDKNKYKDKEKEKKNNDSEKAEKVNKKEEIGWNILRKMGWKGKGIIIY